MNKNLQELINSEEYNEDLALEIARNHGWPDWGYQGYWDVLNTVWTLNRNLSKKDKPMRLVGIDSDWNGAALALTGVGDNKVRGVPFWEKFRILTTIGDLMKIVYRDEIMARNVVKEIINKGDKGIIWIGTNHSYTHYGQPIVLYDSVIGENNRMGVILSNKYKDEIFQIVLHADISDSKNIDNLFKRAVYERNLAPIGFTTKDSPIAHLRDSSNYFFRHQPEVAFRDLAEGYIYFKPQSEFEYCEWTDNYVSQKMFFKYKPYFEARYNQHFKSADAINSYMKDKKRSP